MDRLSVSDNCLLAPHPSNIQINRQTSSPQWSTHSECTLNTNFMYVCICTYVRMCMRMYAYMYVCIYARMYLYMYPLITILTISHNTKCLKLVSFKPASLYRRNEWFSNNINITDRCLDGKKNIVILIWILCKINTFLSSYYLDIII